MKLKIEKGDPKIYGLPKGENVQFLFKDNKQRHYVVLNSKRYKGAGRLYTGLEGQELEKQKVLEYGPSKKSGIVETNLRFIINGENMMIHIPIPLDSLMVVGLYNKKEHLIDVLEKIV